MNNYPSHYVEFSPPPEMDADGYDGIGVDDGGIAFGEKRAVERALDEFFGSDDLGWGFPFGTASADRGSAGSPEYQMGATPP